MEDEARLTVMHGVVEASNADRRVLVYPNAGLTVTSRGLGRVEYIDARVAAAWVGRRLILNNVILAEVLRRIAPYHRGRIVLLDGEAGGGQISAAINLDQTDEWLDGLAQTRGIRLTRIAGVTFLS